MNPRPSPLLKSPTPNPHQAQAAEQPHPARTAGAPKDAAEGAPSAPRPDPHPAPGARIVALLRITAPGRGAVPTATSRCACGRDRSAVGHRQVHALIADHTAHRTTCPLLTEGKNAA